MPYGDGTGPDGRGPRTGRGLGYCNGYNSPGFTRGVPMGRNRGFGFGRGRRWAYEEPAQEADRSLLEELKELREEIAKLKEEIEKRK